MRSWLCRTSACRTFATSTGRRSEQRAFRSVMAGVMGASRAANELLIVALLCACALLRPTGASRIPPYYD